MFCLIKNTKKVSKKHFKLALSMHSFMLIYSMNFEGQ